jgi:hypothetical protein
VCVVREPGGLTLRLCAGCKAVWQRQPGAWFTKLVYVDLDQGEGLRQG